MAAAARSKKIRDKRKLEMQRLKKLQRFPRMLYNKGRFPRMLYNKGRII